MARQARPRRRPAFLIVIVLLFAGSAVARLASGTGAAIAREVGALMPEQAVFSPSEASCEPPPDMALIFTHLSQREAKLAEAERRQTEKEAALTAAETRIVARLAELRAAEDSLAATMKRASTAAEEDVARLTSVYEAMKPKEAVPLFEAMAPEFAAGFLSRMRADAAAAILAGMSPEFAYAVSVILAGRNAEVPRPRGP